MSTVTVSSILQSKAAYRIVTSGSVGGYDNALAFDFNSLPANTMYNVYIYEARTVASTSVIDAWYYGSFMVLKRSDNVVVTLITAGSNFACNVSGTIIYVDFTGDGSFTGSPVRYSIQQVISDTLAVP
jgi:hypothetical protein